MKKFIICSLFLLSSALYAQEKPVSLKRDLVFINFDVVSSKVSLVQIEQARLQGAAKVIDDNLNKEKEKEPAPNSPTLTYLVQSADLEKSYLVKDYNKIVGRFLKEKLDKYAKMHNIAVVLPMSTASFVDPSRDITDDFIKFCNTDPKKEK